MTNKQILDCEYLIKINEMRTCKALNVSFYGDIICRDCIILKLKKQLKRKEQECEELKIYIESNEQQVKEVEKLVMDNDRLINENDQLKQTLAEIKEIAESCYDPADKENDGFWLILQKDFLGHL